MAGGANAPALPGDGAARSIADGGPTGEEELEAADRREFDDMGEAALQARTERQRVDIAELQAGEALLNGGALDAPYLASLNLIAGHLGGNSQPGMEQDGDAPDPRTLVALPAAWAQVNGVPQQAARNSITPPMGRDRFMDYPLELGGHGMVHTKNLKLDKDALASAADGLRALEPALGSGQEEGMYGSAMGLDLDKIQARSMDPDSREELASIDYLVEQGRYSDKADMLWFYKLHAPMRMLPHEGRNGYDAMKRRKFLGRAKRAARRAALSRRLTALEVERRGGLDPGLAGDARGHVALLDGGRIGAPGPLGFPSMAATSVFAKRETAEAKAEAATMLANAKKEGIVLHPSHLPSLHDRTAAEVAESVLRENYLADRSDADRLAAMMLPGGVDPLIDPMASPSLPVPPEIVDEDIMTRGVQALKLYAEEADAWARTAKAMKEQNIRVPGKAVQPWQEMQDDDAPAVQQALKQASTDAAMEARSGGRKRTSMALQRMARSLDGRSGTSLLPAMVEPVASGGNGMANDALAATVMIPSAEGAEGTSSGEASVAEARLVSSGGGASFTAVEAAAAGKGGKGIVSLQGADPFVPHGFEWTNGSTAEELTEEKMRMARLRGEPALKGAVTNAMLKGESDAVQTLMEQSVRRSSEFRRKLILGGQRETSAYERVVDAAANWLGEAVAGSARAATAEAEAKGLEAPELGPSLTTPGDNGMSETAAGAAQAEELARTAEEAMEAAMAVAGKEGEGQTRVEALAAANTAESARGYVQLVESLRAMSGLDGGGSLLHAVHPAASPVLATVGPAGDSFANLAVTDARTLAASMQSQRPVGKDFLGAHVGLSVSKEAELEAKVPNPHRVKTVDPSALHAIDLGAYTKRGWVSSMGFDEDVDELPLHRAMPDLDQGMALPDGLGPRRGREPVPSARAEMSEISRGLGSRPAGEEEGRAGIFSAQVSRHWWLSGGAVGGPQGTTQELDALSRAQAKADAALRAEEQLEFAGDGGAGARGAAMLEGMLPSPEAAADFVKVREAERAAMRGRL